MKTSSSDFFPQIDPKRKPERPEPVDNDWTTDDYDEKCSYCGQIYAYHKPNRALFCAKQIVKKTISEGGELR